MNAVEFGSLFEFIRNGMSVRQDKSGDGLPITRIETISEAVVDATRVGYADLEEKNCSGWLLEPGDILFSHINSLEHIGKCAIYEGLPEKLVHGMNLLCLRPDKSKLTPQFGKYLIRSKPFRSQLFSYVNKSVNQASVSIGNLKPIVVSLPPLPEQMRIAAILDKADSIRRKRQEAVRLTEDLLRSVFLDMFGDPVTNPKGWEVSSVQDLCKIIVDCPHTTPKYEGDNRIYPCIRTSDLQSGFLDYSTTRYVDEIEYRERIARHQPIAGDVLYSREGERFGIAAMVEEGTSPCLGQRMMLLQANPAIATPAFLWGLMNSKAVYHQATCLVGGATSPHVNVGDIKKLRALKPPLALQCIFSSIVKSVFAVRQRQILSVGAADALFNSVLQRAFNGDL